MAEGKQLTPLVSRIHAAVSELGPLPKEGYNKHHKFDFHSHGDVTAHLKPVFAKHGIVMMVTTADFIRSGPDISFMVTVRLMSSDDANDALEMRMPAEHSATNSKGRPEPVQTGIALSYAVKNVLLKMFMLTEHDTPEADEYNREDIERADYPDSRDSAHQEPEPTTKSKSSESKYPTDVAVEEKLKVLLDNLYGIRDYVRTLPHKKLSEVEFKAAVQEVRERLAEANDYSETFYDQLTDDEKDDVDDAGMEADKGIRDCA